METTGCEVVTADWSLGTLGDNHLLAGTFHQGVSFWIIELVVFAVAAVCIRHAVRSGRQASPPSWRPLFSMLMVVAFTFVVEYLLSADRGDSIYCYPESWLIMVLGVPIWIPLGWGWIVYICMATSSKLNMPWTVAPWLDGFLALSIDFLLDPIADQYKWWIWEPGEKAYSLYFEIPLSNFMAWFVIVSSFSLSVRYLSTKWFPPGRGWARDLAAPLLALPPALVAVAIFKRASVGLVDLQGIGPLITNGPVISTVIWACFLWVIVRQAYRFKRNNPLDPVLLYVPISFYGLMLLFLFAKLLQEDTTGYNDYAELALFMPVTALLGSLIFAWPYIGNFLRADVGQD